MHTGYKIEKLKSAGYHETSYFIENIFWQFSNSFISFNFKVKSIRFTVLESESLFLVIKKTIFLILVFEISEFRQMIKMKFVALSLPIPLP